MEGKRQITEEFHPLGKMNIRIAPKRPELKRVFGIESHLAMLRAWQVGMNMLK